MAKWLGHWIPYPEIPDSKLLGSSMVDSAIHPFMINEMSASNFWELCVTKFFLGEWGQGGGLTKFRGNKKFNKDNWDT